MTELTTVLTSANRSKEQVENPSLVNHGERLENETQPEGLVQRSITLAEEDTLEEQSDV